MIEEVSPDVCPQCDLYFPIEQLRDQKTSIDKV